MKLYFCTCRDSWRNGMCLEVIINFTDLSQWRCILDAQLDWYLHKPGDDMDVKKQTISWKDSHPLGEWTQMESWTNYKARHEPRVWSFTWSLANVLKLIPIFSDIPSFNKAFVEVMDIVMDRFMSLVTMLFDHERENFYDNQTHLPWS